jgi:polysaccharide chain length determinant protein (PEP-CTERM system associated)
MHDLIQILLSHLRGMWHRRWIGLAAAWIAAIVGVTLAMRIPERFEASARLYVDTQSLLRPLMAGISIQPNLDQQVTLMSRTLISRPNIEKLVRMADLDLAATAGPGSGDIVDSVMRRLTLIGNPTTNIYQINFRDASPEQARKVVQSLVTIFVESSLGEKREDTVNAVKFIDDQIKRYEAGLKAAEDRLKAFRLKYLGVSNVATQNYFTRLTTLNDQIEATKLQLRAAEESRDAYKRELVGEAPVLLPEVGPSSAPSTAGVTVPGTDARLATLKTDLDVLRRRYTDDHPDVVGVKRIIDQLEEQRKQEVAALNKVAPVGASSADAASARNPVFQQLKIALAAAEANVASLRATLGSYEQQSAKLISSARLVPEVDAELAQLNRDYDIQKKTYEALLARRESASLGEGVADAGGTRFKVVDPPRVSPQPVFPNRLVLLALAFAGSLLVGLAAAFAASEMMPTFHDSRSLGAVTKRPVLGMVTMFPSKAVRRVKRLSSVAFAGASGAFVAGFAGLFAFVFLVARAV